MSTTPIVKPSDISPTKGDKFSPRLYNYLRHRRMQVDPDMRKVYRGKNGVLYIGFVSNDYWFTGSRLISVLCGVHSAGRIASYPKAAQVWNLKEVKNFWPRYLKVGRCAIDPKHERSFIGDAGRYTRKGNKRTCQWCGQVQQMKIEREVIKHERWSNI